MLDLCRFLNTGKMELVQQMSPTNSEGHLMSILPHSYLSLLFSLHLCFHDGKDVIREIPGNRDMEMAREKSTLGYVNIYLCDVF
jgi:hypothetical protein